MRLFAFYELFSLFRAIKSMGYGTKQEKKTPQLQIPRDYVQIVGGSVPFLAQLLQGASYDSHQADQEKH